MARLPRHLPIRGAVRTQRQVQRGATSLRAAYERVGQAVGLSAKDVADCYRLRKRHVTPPVYTKAHHEAMWMLDQSERQLEEHVRRAVADANAIQPLIDGQPRFRYQHAWISIHSPSGWPDDQLLDRKTHTLYVFENKRETESPRPDQQAWLDDLSLVGGRLVVLGTIRPSNYVAVLYPILGLAPPPGERDGDDQDGQQHELHRVGGIDVH